MHQAVLVLVVATLLAGCAAEGPPEPDQAGAPTTAPSPAGPVTLRIEGIVQTLSFEPIPGAKVELRTGDGATPVAETRSGPDGRFGLEEVPRAVYLVNASAAGFLPQTLRVTPEDRVASLDIQLGRDHAATPRNVTARYEGYLECGAEALIISGSCDAAVTDNRTLGADPVFEARNSFDHAVEPAWRTVVVDVAFDGEAHPGMDGLRLTVQGTSDADALGTYERYGRFNGSASFTFRLEPDGEYADGDRPVPDNATMFRFQVYPHSHFWHAACDPATGTCPLGVGGASELRFELLVTTFYVEAAPEGWTLLGA